ncbi:hypothetical protein WJX72_007295 [[Myrmecia] bisecta]|uniref:Major facilitator superfamily (MFS) profile domain-containing protein n=1 Tax=[Myrmecia] bisecta TaxID=41462 RepID=A0AAW1R7Q1_9CHLO
MLAVSRHDEPSSDQWIVQHPTCGGFLPTLTHITRQTSQDVEGHASTSGRDGREAGSQLEAQPEEQSFSIPAERPHELFYLWESNQGQAQLGRSGSLVGSRLNRSYTEDLGSQAAPPPPATVVTPVPLQTQPADQEDYASRMHRKLAAYGEPGKVSLVPDNKDPQKPTSIPSAGGVAAHAEKGHGWGWVVVAVLCAVATMLCFNDRAAMGIAILPMSKELGWDDSTKGAINSIFFIGYTLTNLVAGFLATRYTSKRVLMVGVVAWSAFTILTPAAAHSGSIGVLLMVRALMGMGQGITFPAVQVLVSNWVPNDHIGRANSFIHSGATFGTIVSYCTAPFIMQHYGWPTVFYIYGIAAAGWLLLWSAFVTEAPTSASTSNTAELQQKIGLDNVPWGLFIRCKAVWAVFAIMTTQGVGTALCFFWLPTFYSEQYGMDVTQSSLLSIAPWATVMLSQNLAGYIADTLQNRNILSVTNTRKLCQGIASLGPAACMLFLAFGRISSIYVAMVVMTLALALGGFYCAGAGCNLLDISPKYAAILFGLVNGTSSLLEAASIYGTGLILDHTKSWSLIFQLTAMIHIFGASVFMSWASSEPEFEQKPAAQIKKQSSMNC